MSSSTPRWRDRPEPSTSLGCPSVARRRSRRRLRNVGRQPSMRVIDVDRRCPARLLDWECSTRAFHVARVPVSRPAAKPTETADRWTSAVDGSDRRGSSTWIVDVDPPLHAGKPTPEQPVPQSPLRGRLTGTRGGWKAWTNHSRPDGSGRRGSSMSSSTSPWSGRRSASMSSSTPRRRDRPGPSASSSASRWSDRRGSSTSSSTSQWSARPEPSTSLGCPSVARRRSRRRLRNVGRQPSLGLIDVGRRRGSAAPRRQADSRTTRSAVSPSGATDGHPRWFEGFDK
jgi:hypothetical protein